MPLLIPQATIFVVRNNKTIVPELGVAFEFTAEEVADVEAINPAALRKPLNEAPVVDNSAAEAAAEAAKAAAADSAKAPVAKAPVAKAKAADSDL